MLGYSSCFCFFKKPVLFFSPLRGLFAVAGFHLPGLPFRLTLHRVLLKERRVLPAKLASLQREQCRQRVVLQQLLRQLFYQLPTWLLLRLLQLPSWQLPLLLLLRLLRQLYWLQLLHRQLSSLHYGGI